MKRVLLIMTTFAAALALFTAGCKKTVTSGPDTGPAGRQPDRGAVADPRAHYSPAAGRTFLDTLNQGKEIALSAEDLPAIEVAEANPAAAPGGDAQENRYRIQIMALSQPDMARKAKSDAETAVSRPVVIVSEQSLYKLYVEFKTRQEAEAALPEIRKKGYKEAWIVNK